MLLHEIRAELPILGGATHMAEWELKNYRAAKLQFEERLVVMKSNGINLVARIFKLMDELTEEYYSQDAARDITCQTCAGGWCCFQLVSCTTLEMLVIRDYLESLSRPTRRAICQRVRKHALKFSRLHQTTFGIWGGYKNGPPLQQMLRTKKLMEHYNEKPCPYLNAAKQCSIYSVRPLDCRIAKTRDKICGTRPERGIVVVGLEPKPVRLMFEQVASDLLMDEEIKIYGQPTFVPLAAWPLYEPFRKIFF